MTDAKADLPITEPAPNDGYGPIDGQPDGFNAAWYAHVNLDVVAAGMDPLTHYQQFGKAEGRQPYEGGPGTPSAAVIAAIAANQPAPSPVSTPAETSKALVAPPLPDGAIAAITIYVDTARKVHFISRGLTLPQVSQVLDIAAKSIEANG